MRVSTRVLKQLTGDANATHLSDKSAFWAKVRKTLVVNPDSGTGSVLTGEHRYPQPASRPELFTVPSSKASDIAANAYHNRDFRRMYPKTAMLDQESLTTLLIAQGAEGFTALPAPSLPAPAGESADTALTTASGAAPTLASLYMLAPTAGPEKAAFRPPTPPGSKYKWSVAKEAIPHDEHGYFPMWMASSTKVA